MKPELSFVIPHALTEEMDKLLSFQLNDVLFLLVVVWFGQATVELIQVDLV